MFEPNRETEIQSANHFVEFNKRNSRCWVCQVISEPDSNTQIPITKEGIIFGAAPECNVQLEDATVSKKHMEIRLSNDGIVVKDLGSTNGTFLRSTRIDKMLVTTRCQVIVGKSKIDIFSPSPFDLPPSDAKQFGTLVGGSAHMRKAFAIMQLAAATDATVIIEGESGTGKELAARAIHDNSKRADKPFIVVDCASVPEQLMESQLFGHREGAFTGAVQNRKGAFILANGGTIFLDELGELSLLAQAKLLRVLEAQTVQALGEDRATQIDVRVIAATNRNLEQMVEQKKFRFDLFHRLAVVHFKMPALREHPEDIPMLVLHFYNSRKMKPGTIEGRGLVELARYDWPGNVRELRNVLERAWVLSGTSEPSFSKLKFALDGRIESANVRVVDTSMPFKEAKEQWIEVFEQKYIETVFEQNQRNISQSARHAELNRNHFRKLIDKYGIIKPDDSLP